MRQLVSVVTDEAVRYFVQDGDDVQQIAQTINPGFDVPAVIELGSTLSSALRLDSPPKRSKPERTEIAPARSAPAVAQPRASGALPKRSTRKGYPTAASIAERRARVVAHLLDNPNRTVRQISSALYGTQRADMLSSTGYDLTVLTKRGKIVRHDGDDGLLRFSAVVEAELIDEPSA